MVGGVGQARVSGQAWYNQRMNPRGIRIAEIAAVALLLGLHAWLALSSSVEKSATFDEIAHLGGGYLHWTTGDYRFNAESGALPQRWAAWPLLAMDLGVPPDGHPARRDANVWILGRELLYGEGQGAGTRLQAGRAMIVTLSLLLGGLVYAWSKAAWGRAGGLLSLALYSLSPTMLAHARLVTADLTAALFFLLATGALWRLLERVTPARFAGAALAIAALILSKMSGVLILPIAAILVALRLARRHPLELAWGARQRSIMPRGRRALVIAALAIAVVAVVLGAVWSVYGGRYSAQPDAPAEGSRFLHSFESVLERGGLAGAVLGVAREARLVPEAYLWGLAYTLDTTRERDAFLAGRTGRTGWWWFFPYAVAVKTPLALFGLLGLAAAARDRRPRGSPRRTDPLWALVAVYSLAAVASHLNIGHRHMLPVYPALFIFAGAAGRWLTRRAPGDRSSLRGRSPGQEGLGQGPEPKARILGAMAAVLTLACLGSFAWESRQIGPHYLSYFNQLAGGPGNGYRHLVDSSLDWGQDLPGLATFLRELRAAEGDTPVYAAYFGAAPPAYYGIEARWLYSFFPVATPGPTTTLTGGIYCVSATLLQSMHMELPGPWNVEREDIYRQRRAEVEQLIGEGDAAAERSPQEWAQILRSYDRLRSARLFAFLRRREPDARIGYSIHVYRLSEAEVDQAMNAPIP